MNQQPLPLTNTMRRAYDTLVQLMDDLDRSPTHTELAKALGIRSRGRVNQLLQNLRERGLVDWQAHRPCSLRLVFRGEGYRLDPTLQQRLEAYCASTGEQPLDVVHAAVLLQLDHAEDHVGEIRDGLTLVGPAAN